MPLHIIVIGAGIGGLTAAIALSNQGHQVTIYEKSQFATEIGAALAISPNGAMALSSLGFSFERAQATWMKVWESVEGHTLRQLSCLDLTDADENYGQRLFSVHRVDLHKELLRLVTEGRRSITLKLNATVVAIDSSKGEISVANGTRYQADVIVAADGLHSIARPIVQRTEAKVMEVGLSAFRFLLPTDKVLQDPDTAALYKWKQPGSTIVADTTTELERHLVWYECQDGVTQNIVGIHPSRSKCDTQEELKAALMDEYSQFHPHILKLFELADDIKCWPLCQAIPLRSWTRNCLVVIGDAAHPMLPFGGQAANQAIEDGVALGCFFPGSTSLADVQMSLQNFEDIRLARVGIVQILSSTRIGRELEVENKLQQFTGLRQVPNSFQSRIDHAFRYDVVHECTKAIRYAK